MAEYRAIPAPPKAFDDWGYYGEPKATMQVYEPEPQRPTATGLVDVHGVPLYRMPEKHPVGFVSRTKENA